MGGRWALLEAIDTYLGSSLPFRDPSVVNALTRGLSFIYICFSLSEHLHSFFTETSSRYPHMTQVGKEWP